MNKTTVTLYTCLRCKKVIYPKTGYVIQGNVLVAGEGEPLGGVIGGSNPESRMESAFHRDCLVDDLIRWLIVGREK